jgi:hypothetical protein
LSHLSPACRGSRPAAITGLPRAFFEHGVTHYDTPPPHKWTDLDLVLGPEGARLAHDLRAWIEVHDGKITAFGQDGGLHLNSTLVRLGGKQIAVKPVGYPELRQDPVVGAGFVRFTQTAGGRAGIHAPRHVHVAPFAKIQPPTVWTTLALTIHADGSVSRELVGASSFPPSLDLRRRRPAGRTINPDRLQDLVPDRHLRPLALERSRPRGAWRPTQAIAP